MVVEDKDTLVPIPDAAHPIQTYKLGVIEPTTPDSPAKLSAVASALAGGEYLVIASRRWSATLPRLPNFPLMDRYYRLLLAGDLGYEPAATFQSSPQRGLLVSPRMTVPKRRFKYLITPLCKSSEMSATCRSMH